MSDTPITAPALLPPADDPRLRRLALLDVATVAALLAVSPRTVLRMSARGELAEPVRIGPRLVRWRLTDIEQAIRGARA